MVLTPQQKTHPKWNINSFSNHTQEVSGSVWLLVFYIVIDEQIAGFKGIHQDKIVITYKVEGDIFQMDQICDNRFTYAFYFSKQFHKEITLNSHHCTLEFLLF